MNEPRKDIHAGGSIDRRSGKDRRVTDDIYSFCSNKRDCADRRTVNDRRLCDRFKVNHFTFVKLRRGPEEDLGQLLEISRQGLSFRYLPEVEQPKLFTELSILWPGNVSAITGIPFKTVSDTVINQSSLSAPIIFRRAGVQFEPLTDHQQLELNRFIENHIPGVSSIET